MNQNTFTYYDVMDLAVKQNISEKEACKICNLPYKSLYDFKKKNNVFLNKRGKNPNSRTSKRIFHLNDNYFKNINVENSYWAGFIAADGNVTQNKRILSISLQATDGNHLELFKEHIEFLGEIHYRSIIRNFNNKGNKEYFNASIIFSSMILIQDLYENFNITPNKSKTMIFPNFDNDLYKDSFIKGYIDSDGCIGLNVDNNECSLSLISGSLPFIQCIAERFTEILKKEKPVSIYSYDNNKNKNTIRLNNKNARIILKHLLDIPSPALSRKWDKINEHVNNFNKKHRNSFKHFIIKDLLIEGLTKSEIADKMGMTYQAVHYYLNKPFYKKLSEEL